MTFHPIPTEIQLIRRETREFSDRMRKAGRFGEVMPTGWDADLLQTKTADEWLKDESGKPAARMLFGNFWHENELCILFADTNMGKSVLAVQIGRHLSCHMVPQPFNNQLDGPASVLYIDFELSNQQFFSRYYNRDWGNIHFGHTFFRAQYNPAANDPVRYTDYHTFLFDSIEKNLRQTKATILIIDNLTCLGTETNTAGSARKLIQTIRALRQKYQLSVLALAHTPKRDGRKPITVNDLQGSKNLINFADSAFSIGKSHTSPGSYYLKQIKQRTGAQFHGADNVCLCTLQATINEGLNFQFGDNAAESDHLQAPEFLSALHLRVARLHAEGHSTRHIAVETNASHSKVYRIIQQLKQYPESNPGVIARNEATST